MQSRGYLLLIHNISALFCVISHRKHTHTHTVTHIDSHSHTHTHTHTHACARTRARTLTHMCACCTVTKILSHTRTHACTHAARTHGWSTRVHSHTLSELLNSSALQLSSFIVLKARCPHTDSMPPPPPPHPLASSVCPHTPQRVWILTCFTRGTGASFFSPKCPNPRTVWINPRMS